MSAPPAGELGDADRAALGTTTLTQLLSATVETRGDSPYVTDVASGRALSYAELADRVSRTAHDLRARGVAAGDRVAVLLPNSLTHVVLVHALFALHAVWVPVNTRLIGEPLRHVLTDSAPTLLVADAGLLERVPPGAAPARVLTLDGGDDPWPQATVDDRVGPIDDPGDPDAVVALIYTSGTTGPAKGVQVTDRMLRAAALGAAYTSDAGDGDVLLVWEPLCHIGGAEVLMVPLLPAYGGVRLTLLERFSASRFWDQARSADATRIHHLGGIMSILLGRPATDDDRDHPVEVSWGGGMTAEAWRTAEGRFGLRVHECYGMTEAASICTLNTTGPDDGIGAALPWFEVAVHDPDGLAVADGTDGEIVVRGGVPGLITPGYFRNDAATASSRRDEWWRTGDQGRIVSGNLHFTGRLTDSVRVRGENVSAWEVEAVVSTHPLVADCAVIGVPPGAAEQEIKLFLTAAGATPDPAEVVAWCSARLAPFQVPRYVAVVEDFERTPSHRVQKSGLSRSVTDCYDRLDAHRPRGSGGLDQ